MMKRALFLVALLLVAGIFVSTASAVIPTRAHIQGDGCIALTVPAVTLAREGACTCYYTATGGTEYGTVNLPLTAYYFGVDYTCGENGENDPFGTGNFKMTWTLVASAQGNCTAQHPTESAPWPRFRSVGNFYLQVWDASAAVPQWTCYNQAGTQIWVKDAGGDGENYVTFKINDAAVGTTLELPNLPAAKKLASPGSTTGQYNPFTIGTRVRMVETCSYTTDSYTRRFPIDTCTLCSNCSDVKVSVATTSTCTVYKDDKCYSSASTYTAHPTQISVLDSVNQYATAVKPTATSEADAFTKLFNATIDAYYTDGTPQIGFLNERHPTWDLNNWTDEFVPCWSSDSFCCQNYCCYPPSISKHITEAYLLSAAPTMVLELTASKPWNASNNDIIVKICGDASATNCVASACTTSGFVATCTVPNASLSTINVRYTSANTCSAIHIFATVDGADKIIRRSFVLSKVQFVYPSGSGMDRFGLNPLDIAPPQGKRYAGAWNMNAYQFIVPFLYADSGYTTRVFINNKSLYDVKVLADVFTAQGCEGSSDKCLADIASAENLGEYVINPNTLKRIDFNQNMTPYSWNGTGEVAGTAVPLPGIAAAERYSILLTVTGNPNGQGNGKFPAPEEVTVTAIQKDKNSNSWRTVNVLQASEGQNPWQQ